MAPLPKEELARYAHSAVHSAVARKDHVGLQQIIARLPQLSKGGVIHTEDDAIAEEQRAEALSKELDRRDVPGRETPLHLAVRMHDAVAAEILLAAGADANLQNEQGWSALQEAICMREEAIACLMTRYYAPMAWAKWCRRVPRVIGMMKRMTDFYMEVTFHFESSVIPFIGKIAPSDTYRIWKKGSNLRADMTIAGFDGFKIKRSDQSIVFMGEGSNDGKLPPGSLCMLQHKKRFIFNVLAGAGKQITESAAAREVKELSRTNMYRPGLDVTQAVLMPQLTWRRQERSEMVGKWKTKVYDMRHVQLSLKSRRVPGALTDEELFGSADHDVENGKLNEDFAELLDEEERRHLDQVLRMESEEKFDLHDTRSDIKEVRSGMDTAGCTNSAPGVDSKDDDDNFYDAEQSFREVKSSANGMDDTVCVSSASGVDFNTDSNKKGFLVDKGRQGPKMGASPPRLSYCNDEKVSKLLGDDQTVHVGLQRGRMSVGTRPSSLSVEDTNGNRKDKKNRVGSTMDGSSKENEYTMGLHPVLWLTPNFPLKTEELLPLLDILANKVKAVRRLREVLTTKLPAGTFPVKVAIPVIPTIKVIVTFSMFKQLKSNEVFTRAGGKESDNHGNSWYSWRKGPSSKVAEMYGTSKDHSKEAFNPFVIPDDYVWMSNYAKKHGRSS